MSKSWLRTPNEASQLPMGPLFDHVTFDGETYEPEFDADRLRGEMARVYSVMKDGASGDLWFSLEEISRYTGDPMQSVSARLRDLRKAKFGGHTVNRRRRGDPCKGLHEYQLILKG